jgi:uncharacterized protein (TIGR02246 family)
VARHPSDAERELASIEVLERCLAAAAAGDLAGLAACYAEDAVWLDAAGTRRGRDEAVPAHMELGLRALSWDPPQQHGPKAVLRWRDEEGRVGGAVVVEVRRGAIIFAAVA